MHIIVGCGRLGAQIATVLSRRGKNVSIIDEDEQSFRKLGPEYSGFTAAGDGTDIDILKQAEVERAKMLIAATNDDNVNLMVAQIAKQRFQVPCVIARLYDPDKEVIIEGSGIKTIYPSKLSLVAFEQMIAE